ncbi:MAG: segregation/condensation protein A [Cyanobacteriota bacterium]|nr:segregation/condensation protein A [Cyanobacteriota bacterium]
MAEAGARMAIRMLQDAAISGELDPWDVDVIAVIDSFLDRLHQRILHSTRTLPHGTRFEQDLAESSEAFLAASVLVALKAELLESLSFPVASEDVDAILGLEEGQDSAPDQPTALLRPERQLLRRPVAPPPLQRPVSLGELIRQLEDIAERLEQEGPRPRERRGRRFSDRVAIAQVTALAHREKLPETTAALSRFIQSCWPGDGQAWLTFDALVTAWGTWLEAAAEEDLDRDRVGVFWALLFLSAQGRVELLQEGGLFGPLSLRRLWAVVDPTEEDSSGEGSASLPAPEAIAA